ncbi:unnamed protein product [Parajaminaea phylloscopi]
MSCSHEHHSHGHGHGHGHGHDDDSHIHPDESPSDLLYSSVARDQVTCLNQDASSSSTSTPGDVIKPWHERNDETTYIQSESDDGQLLVRIPFEGGSSCKLRSLLLKAGPGGHTPHSVTLFINQDPPLDFSDDLDERSRLAPSAGSTTTAAGAASRAPAQRLESIADSREVAEYPLRAARFNNVRDVTLFIDGPLDAAAADGSTRLYYVGFRGQGTHYHRAGPANLVYEATPQLKDHKKIPGTEMGSQGLGQ